MCVCVNSLQAVYIPNDLYKRLYESCKRMLTLPEPFCTVGLNYTRQLKTERHTPGTTHTHRQSFTDAYMVCFVMFSVQVCICEASFSYDTITSELPEKQIIINNKDYNIFILINV